MTQVPRIHVPGAPQPGGAMVTACRQCGWMMVVPAEIAQDAGREHALACLGPWVRAIAERVGVVVGEPEAPPAVPAGP